MLVYIPERAFALNEKQSREFEMKAEGAIDGGAIGVLDDRFPELLRDGESRDPP